MERILKKDRWSSFDQTIQWTDGYVDKQTQNITHTPELSNFGSCDGCPKGDDISGAGKQTVLNNVYQYSRRRFLGRPFVQVYESDQVFQWYNMRRYGIASGRRLFTIYGAVSTCGSISDKCPASGDPRFTKPWYDPVFLPAKLSTDPNRLFLPNSQTWQALYDVLNNTNIERSEEISSVGPNGSIKPANRMPAQGDLIWLTAFVNSAFNNS